MPITILMPALSPTMKDGNLVKWLKKEGDTVSAGDVIAEIETDKATMEVEAVDEGRLAKIVVPEGTEAVAVNSVIAILLEEGEDAAALETLDLTPTTSPASVVKEAKAEITEKVEKDVISSAAQDSMLTNSSLDYEKQDRIKASPLARRLAQERGIDLCRLQGSGPYGRIVKADVEAAKISSFADTHPLPTAVRTTGLPAYKEVKISNMRRVIAQRLVESKQRVPHFYLTLSCNIDKLLELRTELNTVWAPTKITVNDMLIRACALALRDVPDVNVSWADDHIKYYSSSDISVAVAIQDGLITPIVRDAQIKTLKQISDEVKSLAAKAREGKLKPEEFQGGTMSISNLGMYGIEEFDAIINPPQACILAIGSGEKRAVVIDDQLAVATMMNCTLSVDHRAIDGAAASEFLQTFKKYVEAPVRLLL